MTAVSRAPVLTRRAAPLVEVRAVVETCPACADAPFRAAWLKTTVLLVCDGGCPGRRVAVALGLEGWPKVLA